MTQVENLSTEQLFEQFKQLPDWERYPMPEVFYKTFGVKKLQPASITEVIETGFGATVRGGELGEVRGPLPGGVRKIEDGPTLPVEIMFLTDQSADDTHLDSDQKMLIPPTECDTKDTQHELGLQSQGPSCASGDSVGDAQCRDAECNPPFQPPQSELSSRDQNQSETPLSISSQVYRF